MTRLTKFLLAICFVLVIFSQLSLFTYREDTPNTETVLISRVIDGDTIELADDRTIRLANINSPEKNSPLSKKATQFLKQFENSTADIQILTIDKYGRDVARVYTKDYLNKELVRLGLASKFLVQEDELNDFSSLEKSAINLGAGIWEHSDYYGCFNLYVDKKLEFVKIENVCSSLPSGFTLKDESRKIYKFKDPIENSVKLYTENGKDTAENLFWNSETHIWNDDRDSVYLFDNENKLAGYYSYGY